MIISQRQLVSHISFWIRDYIRSTNIKTLVVPFDVTVPSAFVLHCAMVTSELVGGNLKVIPVVQTQDNEAIRLVTHMAPQIGDEIRETPQGTSWHWSSVMTASNINGIVLGSVDKTYGTYLRIYGKHEHCLGDIFPVYDVFMSEMMGVLESLWPQVAWQVSKISFESFDFEDVDIEWSFKYEDIILSETPVHLHPKWYTFTTRQKQVLSKINAREKATRHKMITKPFCPIRNVPGLVQ